MVAALFLFFWGFFSIYAADFLYVSSMQEGVYLVGDLLARQVDFIGGPLNAAAVLLMQALRFPPLGGFLLALLYSGIAAGAIRFFRPSRGVLLYAAALAFLSASLYVRQKYAIFGLDMVRVYLRAPIAAAAALALALAYRSLASRSFVSARCRAAVFLFTQLCVYPLMGIYTLLLWGLVLACELSFLFPADRDGVSVPEPFHWWGWGLFLLFPVLPWVWYPLYKTGFPIFSPYFADNLPREITGVMAARVTVDRYLFLALALLFVLAPLPVLARRLFKKRTVGESRFLDAAIWFLIVLLPIIFVVSARWDRNFRLIVGMASAIQDENWDKILTLEERSPNPTTAMIEMRRLALTEKGEVNKFFDRPFFGAPLAEPAETSSLRIIGPELLIRLGNPNIARRHAMDMTQVIRTPVSPRTMRTQTLCSLVLEEYDLADRFLTLLERSIADRSWARRWRRVWRALRAEGTSSVTGDRAVTSDRAGSGDEAGNGDETVHLVERIHNMRALEPSADIAEGFENFLYTIYVVGKYQKMEGLPRRYQEMRLIHIALMRDIEKFRDDFDYYFQHSLRGGKEPIPVLFQDLLLFYDMAKVSDNAKNSDNTKNSGTVDDAKGAYYPVDADRISAYAEFCRLYDSILRQNNPEYQSALEYQLIERYGRTIWYYFAASSALVMDY